MKTSRAFKGTAAMLLTIPLAAHAQEAAPKVGTLTSEMTTIETGPGETIQIQSGHLIVPESRSRNTGRVISIPYNLLKSKSKTPGPAVFLLAGGPGSSGIDKLRQPGVFEVASFFREFADVVAFDQRGAGGSTPNLFYRTRETTGADEVLTFESVTALR